MKTRQHILQIALSVYFAASALTQAADIRTGLVAYWPLDADAGGTTPDYCFMNPMTIVNPAGVTSGQFGNAFNFNGPAAGSMYLTNLHSPDNGISGLPIYRAGTYTIAMWVKGPPQIAKYLYCEGNTNTAGSTAGNTPIVILQTGNNAANNTKLDVIIRSDGNTIFLNHIPSSTVVFDNNWHHIAWVDNLGSAKLYVDGNLDAANYNYTPAGVFTLNTSAIGTLVRVSVANTNTFNGPIDDVALWDRALSQAEVQEVMASSLTVSSPFITKQPVGGTRALGDRITFTTRALANAPMTFQWFKGTMPILDATTRSLTLSNLNVADSGDFTVQVTSSSLTVTSAMATLTVLPDAAPDVRQGLVSWWPMETVGTTTPDPYSHNDMTLVPGALPQSAGMFGMALTFNGTTDYGYRVGGFPIYVNPAYSISLWVKGNGIGQSDKRFFSEGSTNSPNPLFNLGSDALGGNGAIRVYIRNDANTVLVAKNSTRVALDNAWHHVVWTESNGQGKLYIDGGLDESDFTYARSALTPTSTSVGTILRNTVDHYFAGSVDDVAVWNRVLNLTEIQAIRTEGVPPPLMAIPPTITQSPASQSVLTRSKVTLSYVATGTSPLVPQWRKNGSDIEDQTNATLLLNPVILSDAGDYDVVVVNSAGRATSQVATISVTLRPPSPTELKIDLANAVDDTPANTEPGFTSFAIPSTFGPGPFTKSFGGADVTLTAVGTTMESRKRATPVNSGPFTEERLLQDFVFSRDTATGQGLDVAVEFLEPNKIYGVSIWSYDSGSTGNNRVSNWSANGALVLVDYSFIGGTTSPADNNAFRFNFDATSDVDGKILIQGRRSGSTVNVAGQPSVFLNALQVTRRDLRILSILQNDFGELLLTIEAIDPNAPHRFEQKDSLDQIWSPVPDGDVFPTGVNGRILSFTIAANGAERRFIRAVEGF